MLTSCIDASLLTIAAAQSHSGVDRLLTAMADNLFFTVGLIITVIAILSCTISGMARRAGNERTRREIAAYIAEGTMTPEQGERLIQAKFRGDD